MALAYHFDQPTKSYRTIGLSLVTVPDVRPLLMRVLRVTASVLIIAVVTTALLALRFAAYMPTIWH